MSKREGTPKSGRKKPANASRKKATGGARKASAGKQHREKADPTFPEAFADLLRSRKIRVPQGLLDAPPEAYAHQDASFVEQLQRLDDAALRTQAEKIATYAKRQSDRAKAAWEESPLITELRRRKLKEPPRPARVVGAAFSLKKPLEEWSDTELLKAAEQWSERGR